jgi:O-acetyl-ADP-ribose deacetylase (regulator of RNase III)
MNYYEGTVFNTPAKTIVNTVNCVGIMGAGIALEFKLRYPEMYKGYKYKCQNDKVRIGRPYLYKYDKDLWILNFPTKKHWRYNSKIEWIESGLEYFANNYQKVNLESIAFPKLGTNNGGLNWPDVKKLMEQYLNNVFIDVYICLNEKEKPEGIEKEMVNFINKADYKKLINNVGLNTKQSKVIIEHQPIKRFWYINEFKGIGKKSYEKLFKYCYQFAKESKDNMIQMALEI